jgi:ribonucleoside-diphosphate reductase alpha chain
MFSIGGHEGYVTVGLYEDGTPGEIFIAMAKEGSTIAGLMDCFACSISYNLQWGVPLKFLVDKFTNVNFEPCGYTGNPQQVPYAKSVVDYIFRWLDSKFSSPKVEPDPQQVLPFFSGEPDPSMDSACGNLTAN